MLPDLGKYAGTVLSAYGASLFLLMGLFFVTLLKGRRARATLKRVEAGQKKNG